MLRSCLESGCQGVSQSHVPIVLSMMQCAKAILSQFSHTNKAAGTADENADDDKIFKELESAEGEDSDEPEVEEDADKLDASVEASDARMVDQVAEEVEGDYALPSLTRAEINLGRFSLAKVCISDTASIDIYSCLDSSGILQNESAIVQ